MLQYQRPSLKGITWIRVDINALPQKIRYFHHMLQKEKQMLLNNREWVLSNSPLELHQVFPMD